MAARAWGVWNGSSCRGFPSARSGESDSLLRPLRLLRGTHRRHAKARERSCGAKGGGGVELILWDVDNLSPARHSAWAQADSFHQSLERALESRRPEGATPTSCWHAVANEATCQSLGLAPRGLPPPWDLTVVSSMSQRADIELRSRLVDSVQSCSATGDSLVVVLASNDAGFAADMRWARDQVALCWVVTRRPSGLRAERLWRRSTLAREADALYAIQTLERDGNLWVVEDFHGL